MLFTCVGTRRSVDRRRLRHAGVRPTRAEIPHSGCHVVRAGDYNLVHDELLLDGNSRQNLATFCTTWRSRKRTG